MCALCLILIYTYIVFCKIHTNYQPILWNCLCYVQKLIILPRALCRCALNTSCPDNCMSVSYLFHSKGFFLLTRGNKVFRFFILHLLQFLSTHSFLGNLDFSVFLQSYSFDQSYLLKTVFFILMINSFHFHLYISTVLTNTVIE